MRTYVSCLVLFSSSALIACGSDTSTSTASLNGCTAANAVSSSTISVQDYAFAPTCVKVAAGSSLTFVNHGAVEHTVSSDPGAPNTFDNTTFSPGASVVQAFAKAGAQGVHCNYHSQMKLTVIVE